MLYNAGAYLIDIMDDSQVFQINLFLGKMSNSEPSLPTFLQPSVS